MLKYAIGDLEIRENTMEAIIGMALNNLPYSVTLNNGFER